MAMDIENILFVIGVIMMYAGLSDRGMKWNSILLLVITVSCILLYLNMPDLGVEIWARQPGGFKFPIISRTGAFLPFQSTVVSANHTATSNAPAVATAATTPAAHHTDTLAHSSGLQTLTSADLVKEEPDAVLNATAADAEASAGALAKGTAVNQSEAAATLRSPMNTDADAQKWRPVPRQLMTSWGEKLRPEHVWNEYPRPQLRRRSWWQNLNGLWNYSVVDEGQAEVPSKWDGVILVPFCLESSLSGVGRYLEPADALWYHREVVLAPQTGQRYFLRFEAVDYRCTVWVNMQHAGNHSGGNTPFAFDITHLARPGSNSFVVRVDDKTGNYQLRGKQSQNPSKIFYTRVSGIWQSVWIELVPDAFIENVRVSTETNPPRIITRTVVGGRKLTDARVRLTITNSVDQEVIVGDAQTCCTLDVKDARLWSPLDPHLYELRLELMDNGGALLDVVESYAGIRTVGKRQDAHGHWRVFFNNEFIFPWGTLDQGWWPDGLLTPPSDEAMRFDIDFLKLSGFNLIRKHVKVEPRRYYYHCDKIGILVWQDHVSGTLSDNDIFKVPPWSRLGSDALDAQWPDWAHLQYMSELKSMIDTLYNSPSIVAWIPFNEAWGQHRTMEVGRWIKDYDPSRLLNLASGGNFWPVTDIVDQHHYPEPDFPWDDDRFLDYIKVVGEFGGHGCIVPGQNLWNATSSWGYDGVKRNTSMLLLKYHGSVHKLGQLAGLGIAGGVYTQTTDVEGEINGLLTYDRKISKISSANLATVHVELQTAAASALAH